MKKTLFSANVISTLTAMGLAVWVYYYFWHTGKTPEPTVWLGWFTPGRLGSNLVWVIIGYYTIQIPTAALTVFSKSRWLTPALDIFSSFVPLMVVIVALSKYSEVIITAARAEVAWQLFALAVSETVLSIVLTLLATSRFGFLSGGSDQSN